MLAEIKVAPLLIQALFGERFFIMFSVLARWLRDFEVNYSYHSAIMVVIFFMKVALNWLSRFEENHIKWKILLTSLTEISGISFY